MNDPPIMQFSSTRIGINQQTIYASSAAINFKSSAWVIGMDDRVGEVSIELSALDLSISQASFIDTELPSLEVSITGWPGRGASIDSSFPELNAELFAAGGIGSRSPLELPLFDFELSGYPNRVASIEDTFPGLNVELFVGGVAEFEFPLFIQEISSTATVLATITAIIPSLIPGGVISLASAGDITGVFPGFTMSSVGLGGIVADETMRLPRFNFSGTIISGQVADIEMISPQFLSDISAVRSGPGQIDFTIPMISLQALSINPDDGILRFHKERIR